jgi:CheY-like chemotaxis protein
LVVEARKSGSGSNLVLFSPFERRAFGEALIKDCDGWLVKPVRLESLRARLTSGGVRSSSPRASQSGASGPEQTLRGRKFLLAEDNDINALLVERHLARLGAQVVRARDGVDAVARIGKNSGLFDAALMDIRMPGLDGLSAARQIRAMEKNAGTARLRIIALTANASDEDRIAAREAGMDGFLTKPVDLAELAGAMLPPSDQTAIARAR